MGYVEEKYMDVLQNIEFSVVGTYKERPDLSDYDVMRIYEALVDGYTAEKKGRTKPAPRLSDVEQALMDRVRPMCEWRLGREAGPSCAEGSDEINPSNPLSLEDMIRCLRRLLKSLERWHKAGGRQGYVHYIAQFIG